MFDYAIGDVQGCYIQLMRLLELLQFNDRCDRLWFVGDLVNRGPQSLEVLRFVKNLTIKPRVVLGNHDLHLLNLLFNRGAGPHRNADDTLAAVLKANDSDELGDWLRQQKILYHDKSLNVVMTHAGIPPIWGLVEAKKHAIELESIIKSDHFRVFLSVMYGNEQHWSEDLCCMSRLRMICNYFTRMRYCNANGDLALDYKGSLAKAPAELYPWFAVPKRQAVEAEIIFGHWAALEGQCPVPFIYALDTGCVWGRELTALRLQDKKRFSIS